MTEFTRGKLLAQQLVADADPPQPVFTAAIQTEVTRVTSVTQSGQSGDGTMLVYHVPKGETQGDVHIIGAFVTSRGTTAAYGFESPGAGSGIHMSEGDQLWVEAEGKNAVVAVYGITPALLPVR